MQQQSDGLWYSDEYWSFQIGDELTDKYRLDVSGYSGDAGNGLQYDGAWSGDDEGCYLHDGMMFSTYDQDNDLSTNANCAAGRDGGWWFNNCYMACTSCGGEHHSWWTLAGRVLDHSRMMVKPRII